MASSNTIPATAPILLFPVKLETLFENNCLKIRIIPDEIQYQYYISSLTLADRTEGRRFWVRWFIASGDADRELETWRQFCKRHGVNNASKIAHMTRPKDLDKFRKGGALFTKRPYAFLDAEGDLIDVTIYCQQILDYLTKILITENSVSDVALTDGVADSFRAISASLASLSVILDGSPYIVDYLYEKVNECVDYLLKRLEGIEKFYDRNPQFKDDPGAFDLRDSDYFAFGRLLNQVQDFRIKLSRKVVPLEEMVDMYLQRSGFVSEYFEKNTAYRSRNSYPAPTLPLLPDYFNATVEATLDGKVTRVGKQGNPIPPDLQVGIDLESNEQGDFRMNKAGDIIAPEEIRWMMDYDKAVECGMAITIPFKQQYSSIHINEIYVYGIRTTDISRNAVSRLFKSHLYWSDNFSLLKTGTQTNQIDENGDSLSEEELIEKKYRLEVMDEGLKSPDNSDARILSKLLGIKKFEEGPFPYILNSDNTELDNAKKAYAALWDYFKPRMVGAVQNAPPKNERLLDYVGSFFMKYVNARGIAPAFRIDDHPYGIVPICALASSYLRFSANTVEKKYIRAIIDTISAVRARWDEIREKEKLDASGLNGKDAHRKFLQMTAQNPRSVQFAARAFYYGPSTEKENDQNELLHSNDLFLALNNMGLKDAVPVKAAKKLDITRLKRTVKESLPSLTDKEAEYLVCEFLDTFSYRVDVWYMAIVSFYLDQRSATDLKVGSYGWVFNLDVTKKKNADNTGEYIIAPSIQHALTAAILRSAYLQTQADEADTHMCINLSSMRARQALRMIDGIRQGMSTGMILGADLERYFHDAFKTYHVELDRCISPLRKRFPLTIDIKAEDRRAEDYTLQVINGEALLNTFLDKWNNNGRLSDWLDDNRDKPFLDWFNDPDLGVGALLDEDQIKVLFRLIERMADSYDALNDVLLAEGVHRLVAGDKASFAAISSFMSNGSGNLPTPAVLDIPMESAVLAHKVGVAIPRTAIVSSGILAAAEPSVNAWLSSQMGTLKNVIFFVDYTNGKDRSFHESNLQVIGMEPLEFLHLSAYPNALRQALELSWRKQDWKNRKQGQVRILTGDPAELENGELLPFDAKGSDKICLYEFSLLVEDLSSLLGRARPMRVGDIVPSLVGDAEEEKQTNIQDLKKRYRSVYGALDQLRKRLTAFLDSPDRDVDHALTDAQVLSLYDIAEKCTRAGLFNETIPFDPSILIGDIENIAIERIRYDESVEKQKAFLQKLRFLSDALAERLSMAAALIPDGAENVRPSSYIEALQTLTYKNLRVVPHFSVSRFRNVYPITNQTFRSMAKDYRNVDNLQGNEFIDWMNEVAEVRPGMRLYHDIGMARQAMGDSWLKRDVGIFQTLAQNKIAFEWLGWTVSKEEILDDADSLVMFDRKNFDENVSDNAGLIFDSWLEYIPLKKQTAGLVYHCDVPDAEAPQALLYAVYPELDTEKAEKGWDLGKVLLAIESAIYLAKIRTVDPDQIFASQGNSMLGSLLTARAPILFSNSLSAMDQIAQLQKCMDNNLVLNPNGIGQMIIQNILSKD